MRHFFISLFILFFLVAIAQATPVYNEDTGHWYEVVQVDESITWEDAQSGADDMGGYLVSLNSAQENIHVWQMLNDQEDSQAGDFWLGGYQDDYGNWAWDSGEEWGYEPWFAELDDWVFPGDDYLQYFDYLPLAWDDAWNFDPTIYGYVVEYDQDPFATVPEPGTMALLGMGLIGLARLHRGRLI